MPDFNKDNLMIKVLIVDDKKENLIALEKIISHLDIKIYKATSGNEALKLLLENEFAVVLLDVMMPDMDGYEVAKVMHKNDATRHTPIIFLTAMNKSESNYLEGMEAGAIDFLYKPIDPYVVLSKVRIFIDMFEIKNKLELTIKALHNNQMLLEETNHKLKKLANEDSLTKLANRRNFENEFARLLNEAKHTRTILTLMLIDIDNFKFINDKYGHAVGDIVLVSFSERLLKSVYQINSNRNNTFAARLGGDEFSIVAGNISSIENIHKCVTELLTSMQEPIICGENSIQISVSIGIACSSDSSNSMEDLLRHADIALYHAKEKGKNTYVFFEEKETGFIKP